MSDGVRTLGKQRSSTVVTVESKGSVFHPEYGSVERIMIKRLDGKKMGWAQVHRAFTDARPGQWALEVFPPAWALIDEINAYHLWVLPEGTDPEPMRIDNR